VNLVGIMTSPKCLVLEFYENGSLDKVLHKDNLNVAQGMETEFPFMRRLHYIRDMCKAVTKLHKWNICHRDIAMRNLLLSNDKRRAILTDFTMSRTVSSALMRKSTFSAALPRESAPETLWKKSGLGKSYYSLKSDIWSLGVTISEIINKVELLDIDPGKDVPIVISKKWLPSSKEFNQVQGLWTLILRCLEKEPKNRPPSWEVLEKIEFFISDPLNIEMEDRNYIKDTAIVKPLWRSSNVRYSDCSCPRVLATESSSMNKPYMDERLHTTSVSLQDGRKTTLTKEWTLGWSTKQERSGHYCRSISCGSCQSTATNIRWCGDRAFFKNIPKIAVRNTSENLEIEPSDNEQTSPSTSVTFESLPYVIKSEDYDRLFGQRTITNYY